MLYIQIRSADVKKKEKYFEPGRSRRRNVEAEARNRESTPIGTNEVEKLELLQIANFFRNAKAESSEFVTRQKLLKYRIPKHDYELSIAK